MCELYPGFRSCCGIPLRVGLVFIAILSIVTGAMINAAIKKAGVNVSSIKDVLDLNIMSTPTTTTENTDYWRRSAFNVDDVKHVETTKKRMIRTMKKPRWSTVEIIGEDGHTEIIRFEDDYDPEDTDTDTGSGGDDGSWSTTTSSTSPSPSNISTPTTPSTPTTTPTTTTTDVYTRMMGKVNRNGLNLLAIAFIALGIILLAANFMNSPEMALLYVTLLLATCMASLVLLLSVVGECARTLDSCLLSKLDWFSGFILMMFWFVYVFVWAFFAAVANGMAREMQTY